MLSKRSAIYLLTLIVILMTACIGSPAPPSPPVEPTKDFKVVIEDYCTRPNYQLVIDENKHFCFSHPFGYYQDEHSKADKFMLRKNSMPLAIQPDTSPDLLFTSTSLLVSYETVKDGKTLDAFIKERNPAIGGTENEFDLVPWALGEEKAYLRKWVNEKNVSYFIYTEHKNYFYTLEFNSGSSLSDQNTCASTLEELFFIVIDTFTFID